MTPRFPPPFRRRSYSRPDTGLRASFPAKPARSPAVLPCARREDNSAAPLRTRSDRTFQAIEHRIRHRRRRPDAIRSAGDHQNRAPACFRPQSPRASFCGRVRKAAPRCVCERLSVQSPRIRKSSLSATRPVTRVSGHVGDQRLDPLEGRAELQRQFAATRHAPSPRCGRARSQGAASSNSARVRNIRAGSLPAIAADLRIENTPAPAPRIHATRATPRGGPSVRPPIRQAPARRDAARHRAAEENAAQAVLSRTTMRRTAGRHRRLL